MGIRSTLIGRFAAGMGRTSIVLVVCVVFGLTGCGGGGSGGNGGGDGGGDGSGGGDTGSSGPSASDDTFGRLENTAFVIDVLSNDDFGSAGPGSTSIGIVAQPENGTLTVEDSGTPSDPTDDNITYEPDPGFSGTDTFRYEIEDNDGASDDATVTLDVGLVVAAGSDPRTLAFDWSAADEPQAASIDHFRLEVNPDGASGFSPVPGAENIASPGFNMQLPVHLTDWTNALYRLVALDTSNTELTATSSVGLLNNVTAEEVIGYFKASNTDTADGFGGVVDSNVALDADGDTLAIGAWKESSSATGVSTDGSGESDNNADDSGAVYVFTQDGGGSWSQQAYIKASNAEAYDHFGRSVALSNDGNTLAVGANGEDSGATGINGDETDNSAGDTYSGSGAVYVFARTTDAWQQQAYVKASNTGWGDRFGSSLAFSDNGDSLIVGAPYEDGGVAGVNGDDSDDSEPAAGAAYLFSRDAQSQWGQTAYIKASNPDGLKDTSPSSTLMGDHFGTSVALAGDTLVVGAPEEDSDARGISTDGTGESNNTGGNSGAVYIFTPNDSGVWAQQAYVKSSNSDGGSNCACAAAGDHFGGRLALADDGDTLAVGAPYEDSGASGVSTNGSGEADNSAGDAGAVYVFTENASGTWSQQAYVKASNPEGNEDGDGDAFGRVALSGDGDFMAVGAPFEDSTATGIDGSQAGFAAGSDAGDSGAAYFFRRDSNGTWSQTTYIKASNSDNGDRFGGVIALDRSGEVLAIGTGWEDGAATGIGGDQSNNSAEGAGAVYLY